MLKFPFRTVYCRPIYLLKGSGRNYQKLKWQMFGKILYKKGFAWIMPLANFVFVVSHLNIHPAVRSLFFQSSDVIVVKKKRLLKVY